MNSLINKTSLLAVLPLLFSLASCGGGGSGSSTAAVNSVTINGTTYTENGSTVLVRGYIDQTSQYGYQYGGPTVMIEMDDIQSGNTLSFQIPTTSHGFPATYFLTAYTFGPNNAYITDKTVTTGGNMQVNTSGGGSITISHSSSPVGKPLEGSYNLDLCDMNASCSAASIKNYTGVFSVNLLGIIGSFAMPVQLSVSAPAALQHGIAPETGKNYYIVSTNATGGALTLTLHPEIPNGDVNMAAYTDAGFNTPATCDVTSDLSLIGNGVETCAITVAANQKIYFTVSQTSTATFMETYTLNVVEN